MNRPERWTDRVAGRGRLSVTDLEWNAVEWMAFNLRAIDRIEIFGNLPTDNPMEMAAMVLHQTAKSGIGYMVWLDGKPAAAFGVFENFPGNWQIWCFGTDDFPRTFVALRDKYEDAVQYVREHGGHRLECKSHSDHHEAHRMLRLLGFRGEDAVVLRAYGKDRSDYICFARFLEPVAKKGT